MIGASTWRPKGKSWYVCVCVCVRVCVRACVRVCVRACVYWGGNLEAVVGEREVGRVHDVLDEEVEGVGQVAGDEGGNLGYLPGTEGGGKRGGVRGGTFALPSAAARPPARPCP